MSANKLLTFILGSILLVACDDGDPSPAGAACTADEECESSLCVTEFVDNTVVEGGQCTEECEYGYDESGTWDGSDTCPDGSVCLTYTYTGESHCYLDCQSFDDCRGEDGWTCAAINFDGTKACIPPL